MIWTILTLAGTFALFAFAVYFAVRCDRLERRVKQLEERDENKLLRPKD